MRTLYVSDLDGTLLRRNQRTSEYSRRCINRWIDDGLLFTYATARAYQTSHQVTEGLALRLPVILQNGVFIKDIRTEKMLLANSLDESRTIAEDLVSHGIYPIMYSYKEGKERFFYVPECTSAGVRKFVQSRVDDPRRTTIRSYRDDAIDYESVYYFTCIDEEEKLRPFFEKYRERVHCEFQRDLYMGEQWLEIMPKKATKAGGILWLKEYLQCDKVVVFGDDTNDIDMFRAADECYAMENAVDALKDIAVSVIGSNEDDGVVRWLVSKMQEEDLAK